jgi:hypothetical protein
LFIGFAEVIKLLEENNRILLKNFENQIPHANSNNMYDSRELDAPKDGISSQNDQMNNIEIEKSGAKTVQIKELLPIIDENITKRQLKALVQGVIVVIIIYIYFANKFL